jgi:protein TonB
MLAAPARTPDTPSLDSPAPAPVPQVPQAAADSGTKPAPAAAPSAPAAVSGGLLTEGAASGEAADGLRGYRLAVAVQARRFKRYPAQALASGWAGTAEVRIEVGSDGRPRPATVARSSGHEVLDRAALVTIDAGALRARLPESLRGKAFAVVLPVVFNLDEE